MPPSPQHLVEFLLTTVARRLPPIPFRQGAAVARYLEDLAYEVRPGEQRQLLLLVRKEVWMAVFQYAPFKSAGKEAVLRFLEEFGQTHLVAFDVKAAIETVRASDPPRRQRPGPALRAPFMQETLGPRSPRVFDDLTERICAGYWALRFGGVPKARTQLAAALNRHGIRTRSRKADAAWGPSEVAERVKQYENRVLSKRGPDMKAARQWLVKKWGVFYYPNPAWDKTPQPEHAQNELNPLQSPLLGF